MYSSSVISASSSFSTPSPASILHNQPARMLDNVRWAIQNAPAPSGSLLMRPGLPLSSSFTATTLPEIGAY